eukprot:114812-Hanusia_phi.AAC.2
MGSNDHFENELYLKCTESSAIRYDRVGVQGQEAVKIFNHIRSSDKVKRFNALFNPPWEGYEGVFKKEIKAQHVNDTFTMQSDFCFKFTENTTLGEVFQEVVVKEEDVVLLSDGGQPGIEVFMQLKISESDMIHFEITSTTQAVARKIYQLEEAPG